VDFDSTVWPIYDVWQRITGNPLFAPNHIHSWNHPVHYAGGPDAFTLLNQQSLTYEAMCLHSPFPGSTETLVDLQERGVHESLITAREKHGLDAAVRILSDHGYKPEVAVTRSGIAKVEYCLANDIDLLLEDEPDTLLAAHEAGLRTASLRYPYNAAVIDRFSLAHAPDWFRLRPIIYRFLGLKL
jgi:hypothetical protein